MTPQFSHDCELCKFLGHHDGHDLYVCSIPTHQRPTVIARFGNDPLDYVQGPVGRARILDDATGLALGLGFIEFRFDGQMVPTDKLGTPPVDELTTLLGPYVEPVEPLPTLAQLEQQYQDRADAIVPVEQPVLDEDLRVVQEDSLPRTT